jgi:hypothetical protein
MKEIYLSTFFLPPINFFFRTRIVSEFNRCLIFFFFNFRGNVHKISKSSLQNALRMRALRFAPCPAKEGQLIAEIKH